MIVDNLVIRPYFLGGGALPLKFTLKKPLNSETMSKFFVLFVYAKKRMGNKFPVEMEISPNSFGPENSTSVKFYTWRIIPVSNWLVTPIYKPFRSLGRGITPVLGLTNHGY